MEITLYSNYYSSEREQATREFIFDSRADDNPDWETADDISDEEVWEEMDFENSINWDDFQRELEKFFEGQTLIVSGTVGRWDGTFDAGKVIGYNELYKCWSDCDYVEFTDRDGHFHINASHHDGNVHFEVKVLTDKGVERYSNWEYDWRTNAPTEREIHEKLFEDSHYTHIPHFAKKVYGCKTR